jgi:hypothetical protein
VSDLDLLLEIADNMEGRTICALGRPAPCPCGATSPSSGRLREVLPSLDSLDRIIERATFTAKTPPVSLRLRA